MWLSSEAPIFRQYLKRLGSNVYLMVSAVILLNALSHFFFKVGANATQAASLWATVFHPFVLLGVLGFVLTFPVSLNAHKLWPLKKMPVFNLSLVCSILLAAIFLAEVITLSRAIGIGLIVMGSILLGQNK